MANRVPRLSPAEIGGRIRKVRQRRGLSLTAAAGLAGIGKGYLSMLERGERRFERRGLIEDIAEALGCAPTDLTGQPYLLGDRASVEALATLPPISVALYDATLTDVPDRPVRPIGELVAAATIANGHSAQSHYSAAGCGLGEVLTELHIHAVTGGPEQRRASLPALVEACIVAAGVARALGNSDLAVLAARRGQDAAELLAETDPALSGFAAMTATSALSRLGARHRAERVAADSLAALDGSADDTSVVEALGMLHLSSAQLAAKGHAPDRAEDHLAEATRLAQRTGERNRLQFSFGPANVKAWSMSIAVELGEGPIAAERIARQPNPEEGLTTGERRAALHFDLARGYTQAEGARDVEALRHLDLADRIAPQRFRHDPLAHEVVAELDNRNRRRSWELTSLKHRLGMVHTV